MNRKGEWGQNLPPKLVVEDQRTPEDQQQQDPDPPEQNINGKRAPLIGGSKEPKRRRDDDNNDDGDDGVMTDAGTSETVSTPSIQVDSKKLDKKSKVPRKMREEMMIGKIRKQKGDDDGDVDGEPGTTRKKPMTVKMMMDKMMIKRDMSTSSSSFKLSASKRRDLLKNNSINNTLISENSITNLHEKNGIFTRSLEVTNDINQPIISTESVSLKSSSGLPSQQNSVSNNFCIKTEVNQAILHSMQKYNASITLKKKYSRSDESSTSPETFVIDAGTLKDLGRANNSQNFN